MYNLKQTSASLSMIIACLLTLGCGGPDSWKAHTNKAHGHITINGQPPVDALIILKSLGKPIDSRRSEPWGAVDQEGNYQLSTYNSNDGVPTGQYALTIIWPVSPSSDSSTDLLNGQFDTIEKAVSQVEIQSGDNIIADIKLDGIKVSKKANVE